MKKILGIPVILLILIFTACEPPTTPSSGEKTFWAQTAYSSGNYWYNVTSEKLGSTAHCDVYVEIGSGVSSGTAQQIADDFESNVYSQITSTYYSASDVDGNGKIIILLLDILDGSSGGSYVAGYFQPIHLFTTSSYTNSNEADMIYMDVKPGDPTDIASFRTILGHELQHLVNFNRSYINGGKNQFNTWLNEGLSLSAEYVVNGSSQVTSRINSFNGNSGATIDDGNNFYYWSNAEQGTLDNYSTAYMFFQWIRIQKGGSNSIYGSIINQSVWDKAAVENVVGTLNGSSSMAGYLKDWYIASILGSSSGIWGYENEISITLGNRVNSGGSAASLAPGEGVFASIASAYTPSGGSGNITYYGITTSTKTVDTTSSYSGDYVLAFNTDVNLSTPVASNTATLPAVLSAQTSSAMMSLSSAATEKSKPMPIDMHFELPAPDNRK